MSSPTIRRLKERIAELEAKSEAANLACMAAIERALSAEAKNKRLREAATNISEAEAFGIGGEVGEYLNVVEKNKDLRAAIKHAIVSVKDMNSLRGLEILEASLCGEE